METKEITKEKEMMHLADCMASIISQLKEEKKYSAVHTYNSTLNSFKAFSDGDEAKMSIDEVFTAARLKDYEVWLRQKNGKWNTISTYMRTLRAVYNGFVLREVLSIARNCLMVCTRGWFRRPNGRSQKTRCGCCSLRTLRHCHKTCSVRWLISG